VLELGSEERQQSFGKALAHDRLVSGEALDLRGSRACIDAQHPVELAQQDAPRG
jgi:hypothetical protein